MIMRLCAITSRNRETQIHTYTEWENVDLNIPWYEGAVDHFTGTAISKHSVLSDALQGWIFLTRLSASIP